MKNGHTYWMNGGGGSQLMDVIELLIFYKEGSQIDIKYFQKVIREVQNICRFNHTQQTIKLTREHLIQ